MWGIKVTKQDYILIANTISDFAEGSVGLRRQHAKDIATKLAAEFLLDNPRFNPEKFLNACLQTGEIHHASR